jgi:hypothetical protein
MRWPRIWFVLAALGLLTACSDDSKKETCPEDVSPWQAPFVAPTSIPNLLLDLKLAYNERNIEMFESILDPGFTFIFDPKDVGSGHGIPSRGG